MSVPMRCRVLHPAEVDPILDAGAIVEVIQGADYQRLMDVLAEHAKGFERIPVGYIPVRHVQGAILASPRMVHRTIKRLGYFGYMQSVYDLEGLDSSARNFLAGQREIAEGIDEGKAGDHGD